MTETVGDTALHWGDLVVIIGYFCFVLFVGLWSSRSNRGSTSGYFLAGRNMHWALVGASLFASNIGSIHFVGLAGSGAAAGIGIAVYELNALFIVLLLGWLFVPVYIASGVYTMPEFLKKRFGGTRIQIYLSVMAMIMYIFTKISADLYAGAIFIEQSLNWNIYLAILALLAIAALFTITGGLTAVIWTDFIQTIIMLIGAFVLMTLSFIEVGGFEGLKAKYPNAIPNTTLYSNDTCGYPREDYMNLIRDPITADLPWPGIIGLTINSVWYWCADQVIVQRALAAKNFTHAKAGTVFTGYLKTLPLFLLVFPGMIARVLFPDTVGCADPDECERICGSRSGCSNIAYPTLVLKLMPAGARGLMLAVMMAALMSSLTSIFNSSSTIFTMDIWTRIRRKASDTELMIVGRVFVCVLVVISIIWIPVLRASQGSELFVYIQEVSSFQQPPICAVFLLGILWKRINEKGAFAGLMVGFIVGMIRFIVEYSYDTPECGDHIPDTRPAIIKNFHYLYFAIFLFLLTILVTVVISLLTKPIDEKHLYRLTFWTRFSKEPRVDLGSDSESESSSDTSSNSSTKKEAIELEVKADNRASGDKKSDKSDQGAVLVENKNKDGDGERKEGGELISGKAVNNRADEDRVKKETAIMADVEKGDLPRVEIIDNNSDDADEEPCWKRSLKWICGIEKQVGRELTQEEKQAAERKHMSLEEDRKWRIFTNVQAVLVMVIATALWGFFA